MPTVLRIGPYRFSFLPVTGANHYISMLNGMATLLNFGLILSESKVAEGLTVRKLEKFQKIIYENEELLIEAWNE